MADTRTPPPRLWQRYLGIAAPYWHGEDRWRARAFVALLLALLLAQTGFAVLINQETGEFTSALAAGDAARFWHAIRWCLLWVCGAVPTYALYYLVRDRLGNRWRRWLTHRFLDHYFSHRQFYALNAEAAIDNPDQRIAEDIASFTQKSLFFGLILVGSLIQLAGFSRVLWSISPALVVFLLLYATVGTAVTLGLFGRPLTALNFRQLRREADLRFALIRVRENAESIALYRGEAQELAQVQQRFAEVYDNFNRLIRRQFFLNLFQYAYGMLTLLLPSVLIARQVLSGEMEVGRAVQAAGAFTAVLVAISLVVDNFENLSRFAAGVERLDAFFQRLRAPARRPGPASAAPSPEPPASAPGLRLHDLTVQTPAPARVLVRHLSLTVAPGEGLLIVGPSGSGKSALLRTITGLWPAAGGHIQGPVAEACLFLPQQPYMLLGGSLRSQLLYPRPERPIGDGRLLAVLEQVHLPELAAQVGGLDAQRDWAKMLSMGEQQRLAFARLLLGAPRFAFLDEATSALDLANEAWLYRQLLDARITPISIGHHASLLPFHAWTLELLAEGRWRLMSAQAYCRRAPTAP